MTFLSDPVKTVAGARRPGDVHGHGHPSQVGQRSVVMQDSWEARICRHVTESGSVIVPPRIARWLESKAGVTAEWRIGLRGTDTEAYEVLLALHLAALRSDCGTNSVDSQRHQPQSETWLSTTEAAAELHVSDRCVRNWCNSGRLPATMSGGRWLINRAALSAHKLIA